MKPTVYPHDGNTLGRRWAWFFATLLDLRAQREDVILRRLAAARRFLEENLEEPLTLEDAARAAHLSKYHFLRRFKDAFDETPHQFLRRRRLEAAGRLLTRTELPVTDICFRVGFESLGSFSTLFRKHAGHSPVEYRRTYIVVPRRIVPAERLIPGCYLRRFAVPPKPQS